MKRLLWLLAVFVLLTLLPASSLSAASLSPPTSCPTCGSRNLTFMYTVWFTSNLPKINHGVWRCDDGHTFNHYPPMDAQAEYESHSAPEPIYPEDDLEEWHAVPLPIP